MVVPCQSLWAGAEFWKSIRQQKLLTHREGGRRSWSSLEVSICESVVAEGLLNVISGSEHRGCCVAFRSIVKQLTLTVE